MKYSVLLFFALLLLFSGCKNEPKDQIVLIKTDYGDIKIKLYNETPLHRDNFLKLTKEGFYDGLLFHRVIQNFMIQGGDPDSKNAPEGKQLGNGGPGYTIPAEIRYPELFHKKGVIAAAREGDAVNPEKRSSGSQFYIVQGKTFTDEQLDEIEDDFNKLKKQKIYFDLMPEYEDSMMIYRREGDFDAFSRLQKELQDKIEKKYAETEKYVIPENIREVYKTIGGTPHLDGNYTVFGEVIEGLDVVDSIAAVKTDKFDRPVENIKMTIEVVK